MHSDKTWLKVKNNNADANRDYSAAKDRTVNTHKWYKTWRNNIHVLNNP